MASGQPWSPAVSACGYCLHEAEALWASALPCYDACVHAISSLTKMDLKEIASLKRPPQLLVPVCDCVLLLLGLKPGFEAFCQLFGRSDGMRLLFEYDKDNVPPKVLKTVATHIVSMCSPDAMRSVSKAGVSLVQWCQGACCCCCQPVLAFIRNHCSGMFQYAQLACRINYHRSPSFKCEHMPFAALSAACRITATPPRLLLQPRNPLQHRIANLGTTIAQSTR
jgi:hypothetical protein